jgi:hypothetical protein
MDFDSGNRVLELEFAAPDAAESEIHNAVGLPLLGPLLKAGRVCFSSFTELRHQRKKYFM